MFVAKHEMPIVLTKMIPQYPSISEIEYGFSLDEFATPMIIYRQFQQTEIKFQTLEGWKNLRKLLIEYYKISGEGRRQ